MQYGQAVMQRVTADNSSNPEEKTGMALRRHGPISWRKSEALSWATHDASSPLPFCGANYSAVGG